MLADVYVLAPERLATVVAAFLDRFLPDRLPSAAEYEVPQFAERPEVVFADAAELIRLAEARPELQHAVYWKHRLLAGEPRAAHVFFLPDGGMVLGLSTAHEPSQLLEELRAFAGGGLGYVTYEQPPAWSIHEFQQSALSAAQRTASIQTP